MYLMITWCEEVHLARNMVHKRRKFLIDQLSNYETMKCFVHVVNVNVNNNNTTGTVTREHNNNNNNNNNNDYLLM
jgi:hypothetical protein